MFFPYRGSQQAGLWQSLVTYSVLTKSKCLFDQMRKGLMTLNVLSQIERYPEMFEHLFVDNLGNVTSDFVKNVLHIRDEDNSIAYGRSIQMLMSFLDTC